MNDEILEHEYRERMLDLGIDEDTADILTAEARENGLFEVPEW